MLDGGFEVVVLVTRLDYLLGGRSCVEDSSAGTAALALFKVDAKVEARLLP